MNDWITVMTFTLPQDAYLAKSILENENIETFLQDELSVQVDNFNSNALGGVKLQVHSDNLEPAKEILTKSGHLKEGTNEPNAFYLKLDRLTQRIPFVGKFPIEFRLISVVGIVMFFLFIPSIISPFSLTPEKLTTYNWCVEKVVFKGIELQPNSIDAIPFLEGNCKESIVFEEYGVAKFPGINSSRAKTWWKIQHGNLVIRRWSEDNDIVEADKLQITESDDKFINSLYLGEFEVNLSGKSLILKSKHLTIFASKGIW